jgi:hypothetical protein
MSQKKNEEKKNSIRVIAISQRLSWRFFVDAVLAPVFLVLVVLFLACVSLFFTQ